MNLLLDTHIAIWAISQPHTIQPAAAVLINDLGNEVFVSAASIWEIGIKFGSRRPGAPPFSADDAVRYFTAAGYHLLSITPEHAVISSWQPRLHADPFDRILVAQAMAISARLVTRDRLLQGYGDVILRG